MVKDFLKDKKFESAIFFTKGEREKNGSCLTYRTPLDGCFAFIKAEYWFSKQTRVQS